MNRTIFIGEPNNISIKGLKAVATGVYDNAATVSFTVKDAAGVTIAGTTANQPMPLVAGSTHGEYLGVLSATESALIPVGDVYVWIISDGKLNRKIKCVAKIGA
jgi:hypothetical protein